MGTRYKFFRDTWNDEYKHNQRSLPDSDLYKIFVNNDDLTYEIPLEYRYRPDLIAMLFYKDPKLFWVLVYANSFNNCPEDFEVGVKIRVPKYRRVINLV